MFPVVTCTKIKTDALWTWHITCSGVFQSVHATQAEGVRPSCLFPVHAPRLWQFCFSAGNPDMPQPERHAGGIKTNLPPPEYTAESLILSCYWISLFPSNIISSYSLWKLCQRHSQWASQTLSPVVGKTPAEVQISSWLHHTFIRLTTNHH